MNIQVQKINVGAEKIVILSEKMWKKIASALEDLDDIIAYDRAKKNDDGTRYSMDDIREMMAVPKTRKRGRQLIGA